MWELRVTLLYPKDNTEGGNSCVSKCNTRRGEDGVKVRSAFGNVESHFRPKEWVILRIDRSTECRVSTLNQTSFSFLRIAVWGNLSCYATMRQPSLYEALFQFNPLQLGCRMLRSMKFMQEKTGKWGNTIMASSNVEQLRKKADITLQTNLSCKMDANIQDSRSISHLSSLFIIFCSSSILY